MKQTQTKIITKKKPKICIVTWYCCLRNIKLAIGASLLGYEMELITKEEGWNLVKELQFDHIFDHVRTFDNNSQMEAAIRRSTADLFWCHNEPDVMTVLANEVKGKRIVIHDVHDLPTLHAGLENNESTKELEKLACEKSDFLFVPTPTYIDIINKKYGIAKHKIIQVNSCSPSIFFPSDELPRVNGMVYCGQVNVESMKSELKFRDVLPLFEYLTSLKVASHIYYTNPQADLSPYMRAGAITHSTLRMFAANHQYTRYEYGFVGSSVECKEIENCMPNKLWDCIAAGIPLINLNSRVSGDFILKYGIGIDVIGLEALNQVPWIRNDNGKLTNWEIWETMRKKVKEIRYEFTAEKEIRRAFDLIGI